MEVFKDESNEPWGKNRNARLWAVYPLYEAEKDFKVSNGSDALEQLWKKLA